MAVLNLCLHLLPRRFWRIGLAVLFIFGEGGPIRAQNTPAQEYQLKAVFLFNFIQFVDWPAEAFPQAQSPLIIGVLGDNPFNSYLEETVQGENMNGHPVVVRHYHHADEIGPCHILFISQSEDRRLTHVLADLKGRSILTVGDMEAFTQRGGMIRFITQNNKIHLQINVDAAKAAKLTISSKLLAPAQIITSQDS
ncbi:MAG TPA: YfiR family protein [Opitutaceae bacterium]|nr:YfiR family protein [Opitutaceae bacterium]